MKSSGAVVWSALAFGLLLLATVGRAGGLGDLPPNTWVAIKPGTVQPAAEEEKGGWNKLVYDAAGQRVLFYNRWRDEKHGGATIYGNCLFSFEPASARLTPLKIDHWVKKPRPGGWLPVGCLAGE